MKNTNDFDQLVVFIKNQQLIQIGPTLDNIQPSLLQQKSGSIFFGTGICTPDHLSIGLPFDFLGMLLTAESFRKKLGFKRIIHQIADTHAISNGFDPKLVKEITEKTLNTCKIICKNLGLVKVEIVLASKVMKDDLHKELNKFTDELDFHEYIKKEVADIEWFRQKHNACLKIGWTIQNSKAVLGNDERVFDQAYQKVFKTPMSFIFLKPGRTSDKSRQKVSPYISIHGESRLMLEKDENIEEKVRRFSKNWEDDNCGGTMKHLRNVTRVFEQIFGNLTGLTLEEKINFIIQKVLT